MATRKYLTTTAAGYTPTTKRGSWTTSSATLTGLLATRPAGTSTTSAVAVGSTTANRDILIGRWISDGAVAAGTTSGTVQWVIGILESNAALNAFFHIHIFVTAGDSDTVRGTLLTDSIGATEWGTAYAGLTEGTKSVGSVSVQVGDRLVVEVGYRASSSNTAYTGTVRYGGTSTTDLTNGSTTTADSPWIELSQDGIWSLPFGSFTDDFASSISGSWSTAGTVNVSSGRARIDSNGYSGLFTTTNHQLCNSAVYFEIPGTPTMGSAFFAGLHIQSVDGTFVGIYIHGDGTATMENNVAWSDGGLVTITYNATTMRWWRIRHDGTSIYWESSIDRANWTIQRTVSTAPQWSNWSDLGLVVEAGDGTGAGDYLLFDNLNLLGTIALSVSVNDTVTAADSTARAVADGRAVTDTITAGDSPARTVADGRVPADTVTAGDSPARAVVQSRAVTDAVAAGDSPARAVADGRGVTDAVAAADAVASNPTLLRVPADAVTIGDSPARTVVQSRAPADTAQLADNPAAATALSRAVTDAVAAGDSTARAVVQSRAAADTAQLADNPVGAVAFSRAVADNAALADTASRAGAYPRASTDTAQLADNPVGSAGPGRLVSDTVALADSVARSTSGPRIVADAVALADTSGGGIAGSRPVSDTVALADTGVAGRLVTRSVTDTVGLVDVPSGQRSAGVLVSDTVVLADSITRQTATSQQITDAVVLADQVLLGRSYVRLGAEQLLAADAGAAAVVLIRLSSDLLGLADLAVAGFTVAAFAVDGLHLVDVGEAELVTVPIVIAGDHRVYESSTASSIHAGGALATVRRSRG